jgi:hypothetical protein
MIPDHIIFALSFPVHQGEIEIPTLRDYIACLMSMQYTILAVPVAIDRALRQRARREAKSLNAVAVEALARGLKLDAKPVDHTDLDALIGSWQEDKAFDRTIADFERFVVNHPCPSRPIRG